jgi:hypothetical protein
MTSGMEIWPFLDSFLREVNTLYHCVNAEYCSHQFDLAMDPKTDLPNQIMCMLCICISIGCKISPAGTDDMAIMWYENGRRYLDNDDWGCNLNVMRALALISMFHRNERPSTARYYLGLWKRSSNYYH